MFRLFPMTAPFRAASLGSPGVVRIRWLIPVRPGDTVRAVATVTEVRASSKPERGIAVIGYELLNQHDEVVMSMSGAQLLRRRPAEA